MSNKPLIEEISLFSIGIGWHSWPSNCLTGLVAKKLFQIFMFIKNPRLLLIFARRLQAFSTGKFRLWVCLDILRYNCAKTATSRLLRCLGELCMRPILDNLIKLDAYWWFAVSVLDLWASLAKPTKLCWFFVVSLIGCALRKQPITLSKHGSSRDDLTVFINNFSGTSTIPSRELCKARVIAAQNKSFKVIAFFTQKSFQVWICCSLRANVVEQELEFLVLHGTTYCFGKFSSSVSSRYSIQNFSSECSDDWIRLYSCFAKSVNGLCL